MLNDNVITLRFANETSLEADKVNKIEIFVGTRQNEIVVVSLSIEGGKIELVRLETQQCVRDSIKKSTKILDISAGNEVPVSFYVSMPEHGEFTLTATSGGTEISEKFKTFNEKTFGKLFDLRSQRFSSFYMNNDDENLYETTLNVQGNLLENLENVERLL